MKKIFTLLFSVSLSYAGYAQNNVGINTSSPEPSAALDVSSTTQGMLVPRLNKTQRDEINMINGVSSPATGLLVYQTDNVPGFYFYNGSSWTSLNGKNGSSGANGQGFTNGTAAGQVYLTGPIAPFAPQDPLNVTGDVSISNTAVTTIVNGAVNTAKLADAAVSTPKISATGTANATTFLRGDGSWAVPAAASAGVKLELVATKVANTQTLPNANGSNSGDVVVFDRVVTSPVVGSYNASTNAYTAGSAGLYLIQVKLSVVQNATPNNTVSAWSYVEVNGSALSTSNVYAPYITNAGGGSNLPLGYKGLSSAGFMVYLNANDFIKIKGLNQNSAASNTLDNNGGCQLMIVKLN